MQVLLVDDHEAIREELRMLLAHETDIEVGGSVGTAEEAMDAVGLLHPDVVVMDLMLPGMGGIEATRLIHRDHPATRIVALSNHSGRKLVQAVLEAGALGYVSKAHADEEMVSALRAVHAGRQYISRSVDG